MLLLNYRPIPRQPTGIGVVAKALQPALSALPHQLVPGEHADGLGQRLRRQAWSQWRLPAVARGAGASLIFTPVPEGYLGEQGVAQVVFVHDLRPLLHPAGGWQSLYYRRLVPALLRQCRHILTNSHYTAAQISATVGIAPERITPIALGVDHSLFCPRDGSDGNSSPYLLHVGQHYPHKNLLRLLRAFAPLSRRHRQLKLVLAGKPHRRHTATLMRAIDDLGLQARVQLLPYVSGPQLAELYRDALALVFPSLWEGYGLPILEAMACGTPVITSRGSGCQEAAQGCALLVDPWDDQDLGRAMDQLIGDGRLRLELQAQGLRRTAGLTWDAAGQAARSALAALL